MKKLHIILVLTILPSCSILENDYVHDLWASVAKVEIVSNNNKFLLLSVDLGIPTPCNEYDHHDIKVENDTVIVKYFTKIKRDVACTQILSQLKIIDVLSFEKSKTYLFKFWQLGNTYLDTLISIH